uniref:Transmembrane protein n=1 Tax=Steinernema glaseri TaxID=37863 RepID=A0A1I8AGD6_9BILA
MTTQIQYLSTSGPPEMKSTVVVFALLLLLICAVATDAKAFFQAKADDFADFERDPYPTHTNCSYKKLFIFNVMACHE